MEEYKPYFTASIYMKSAEQITNTIEYLKENNVIELSYNTKVLYQMNFEQTKELVKVYTDNKKMKKTQ